MNYLKLSHDEIEEKLSEITHERDTAQLVVNESNHEIIKLMDAKLEKIRSGDNK